MDRERWRRIEDLYHAAQSLSPAARAPFLAAECGGDEALRSEIESLTSVGKSLMPEGFENQLTVQDMADLLQYLATP